jgi:hypothetical protein
LHLNILAKFIVSQEIVAVKELLTPVLRHAGRFISENTFPKAPQKPLVPTFIVTFSVSKIRKIKMGRSVNDVRLWISFSVLPHYAKANEFTVTLEDIFHDERFGGFFRNSNAARLSCQLLGLRRQCSS